MAVETGLCQTWSKTPHPGFLITWLQFFQDSPPGAERTSPWSADQLRKIESTLKPHNQRQGDADQSKASPLKKALKKGQNILSKYLQKYSNIIKFGAGVSRPRFSFERLFSSLTFVTDI